MVNLTSFPQHLIRYILRFLISNSRNDISNLLALSTVCKTYYISLLAEIITINFEIISNYDYLWTFYEEYMNNLSPSNLILSNESLPHPSLLENNSLLLNHRRMASFKPLSNLVSVYQKVSTQYIFIIGGGIDSRRVVTYNMLQNKYFKTCGLSLKRSTAFSVILHKGLIFVVSGTGDSSIGTVEIYNIIDNKWITIQSLPVALNDVSLLSVRGELYVIGGISKSGSNSIFRFAGSWPKSNYWIKCNNYSLSEARWKFSSIEYNGAIYCVGGNISSSWFRQTSVEIFPNNLVTDTAINSCLEYSKKGPTMNNHRKKPLLHVYNNCLYAIGGDDGLDLKVSIEFLDTGSNEWITLIEPQLFNGFPGNSPIVAIKSKIYLFNNQMKFECFDFISGEKSLISPDTSGIIPYHLSFVTETANLYFSLL
eukprot:gene5147-7167_t